MKGIDLVIMVFIVTGLVNLLSLGIVVLISTLM
jgi:hypothetical protein